MRRRPHDVGQGPVRIWAVRLASCAHGVHCGRFEGEEDHAMSRLGHAHVSFDYFLVSSRCVGAIGRGTSMRRIPSARSGGFVSPRWQMHRLHALVCLPCFNVHLACKDQVLLPLLLHERTCEVRILHNRHLGPMFRPSRL